MDDATRLLRWRLILGPESQQSFEGMGCCALQGEADLMDQALDAIYQRRAASAGSTSGARGAGRGMSSPRLVRWLGDIRSLFSKDLVTILQEDAVERCGLKQLLLEPELLDNLEPDMGLASTLLTLMEQVPEHSKENVRTFIRRIVEAVRKRTRTSQPSCSSACIASLAVSRLSWLRASIETANFLRPCCARCRTTL